VSLICRREGCAGTNSILARRAIVSIDMETRMAFSPFELVDDVMSGRPETIRVFLAFKMRCVGCPIGAFHTIDDVCREHGVDRDAFLKALCACSG
jgi:hybrid cluster-associated redox disulfide protein